MQQNSKEGGGPSSALRASSSRSRGEAEDIAIIGGGIIGICAATLLAEAGRSVIVFDRTGVCEETSSGNAAAFAFSDVLPLAHKG
ncbi:FAD-dependent oxidoreductase, partial [Mesorhizobium sp.]|uniref:FAD-dependent oxidoreductase n=1 Tax=Mesorhizobium sp. TaxID=1871066 RepID=UPI0025BC68ED